MKHKTRRIWAQDLRVGQTLIINNNPQRIEQLEVFPNRIEVLYDRVWDNFSPREIVNILS